MGKKALLLGAGGPLGALEAGALMALHDNGVKFDVVSGACIGSILALAYTSPAGEMTGREALELWINSASITDYIYDYFPVNFKIFQKDGSIFNDIWDKIYPNFFYNPFLSVDPKYEIQRYYNDAYCMWVNMFAPSTTNYNSKNLSRISENSVKALIDFDKLKKVKTNVYINALNITKKEIQLFDKNEITAKHVVAGSSLFFIAQQQYIDGNWYGEGSYVDSLNFKGVLQKHDDIDTIVVMNILNKDALIRRPKNLYDAYQLSVMLPFVSIARDDIKIFKLKHKNDRNLLQVEFEIPTDDSPNAMDWSYSNFKTLRDIGYKEGEKFFKKHKADLL